ncbi:MAG: hypothetical protein HY704_14475 [Gemmatimonadetes bacterium]|nr:hypothetical protein [Gemmatimonadota bacterium]
MREELGIDPITIDVGGLVRRSVASLYSHLVTRPTGRAVRLAIERQLAEAGGTSISLIDLSEVAVVDFSCADEVVAKLVQRYVRADRPGEAYFVLLGVHAPHRDPLEEVLRRQSLALVAETGERRFEVLGEISPLEMEVWSVLEERGRIRAAEVNGVLPDAARQDGLGRLMERRLAFRQAPSGDYHALSALVRDLL